MKDCHKHESDFEYLHTKIRKLRWIFLAHPPTTQCHRTAQSAKSNAFFGWKKSGITDLLTICLWCKIYGPLNIWSIQLDRIENRLDSQACIFRGYWIICGQFDCDTGPAALCNLRTPISLLIEAKNWGCIQATRDDHKSVVFFVLFKEAAHVYCKYFSCSIFFIGSGLQKLKATKWIKQKSKYWAQIISCHSTNVIRQIYRIAVFSRRPVLSLYRVYECWSDLLWQQCWGIWTSYTSRLLISGPWFFEKLNRSPRLKSLTHNAERP